MKTLFFTLRAIRKIQRGLPMVRSMIRKKDLISVLSAVALAAVMAAALAFTGAAGAAAQNQPRPEPFTGKELLKVGHRFFEVTSSGLAHIIERAVKRYGQPNGYILGEEASAAFFGGLRYGEGTLYTKNAGDHKIYWQGPSVGWDFGADGNRTMMLVYNLAGTDKIHRRYLGISGAAYFIGGLGMTAMKHGDTILVPVRSGIGGRLGGNIGYLKIRSRPSWNPF